MKKCLFCLGLLLAPVAHAAVESMTIKGKVVSFDLRTVTIEIAGDSFKFKREKLGPAFTSLKKGETVLVSVDKNALN